MKRVLDTNAGVQDSEIWCGMWNDNDGNGCGRRRGLSIGGCKVYIRNGLKLRSRRRICLDKVLQGERLAIVLRSGGLLAGMLATIVRGGVGSETEQHLRAGEAITPQQCAQQQESHERIGNGPHRKTEYNTILPDSANALSSIGPEAATVGDSNRRASTRYETFMKPIEPRTA